LLPRTLNYGQIQSEFQVGAYLQKCFFYASQPIINIKNNAISVVDLPTPQPLLIRNNADNSLHSIERVPLLSAI